MPKYKVKDMHLNHDGKLYEPGDAVEMTEAQAKLAGLIPGEKPAPGPDIDDPSRGTKVLTERHKMGA